MRRYRGRSVLPWLVLVLGAPVSIWLFLVLQDAVENVARLRFERQASDARGVIEVRINYYANVLYGLKALFASNASVSRLEFQRFVKSLDLPRRYPGLDVVNFAIYLPGTDKQRFEEAVRNDTSLRTEGYPHFTIKPAGDRPEYHVIVYLEPMVGYEFAFGLDLGANPAVSGAGPKGLAALQHAARDSGKLTASGLPIRIKAQKDYVGLAMRLAVYRSGMPVDTVEERRAAYVGSVGAGFNVQQLMKGAIDDAVARFIQFKLYDAGSATDRLESTPSASERLLFDSNDSRAASLGAVEAKADVFRRVLPMEVGGRVWEIHFSAAKRNALEPVDALLPWVVLVGGILSSALLFGVLSSLASSRSRAVAIANTITKDLRRSEASLAEAQRMAHLGNWSFDPATQLMRLSAETYRIFGLPPAEDPIVFNEFLQRIHSDDRHVVKQMLLGAISAKEQRESEHRIRSADGMTRWVHTIVRATSRAIDAPVPGTMMDITERKLAEQELLESRALLIDAQKLAHVGCCHYNPSDGRVFWTDELYRIHGINPQEFVPTYDSSMALVHEDDRKAWQDVLERALREGTPFTMEFRIVRPDGSVRNLRSLGEVINNANGGTTRMLWSVLDITEQKRTEDALRASAEQLTALSRRLVEVQEAERRKLSRELHDRVGQNLTALSINLDMLRTSLADESHAEHRMRLSDSEALLESTVDSIEDVMAELRPPMLDDYGLLPALHWYAQDFSRRTGIAVNVAGKDGVDRSDQEIEITLFRIAQEALINVAKHAHAKRVQVELDQTTGHCRMTVTDDGIGIDGARRQRPGLGMVTMRERAQAVGGDFKVRNVAGGGTHITIDVPAHGHTHTDRG
ncbi:MAG: sensor histidine kinase [Burkholderiales bacterium]